MNTQYYRIDKQSIKSSSLNLEDIKDKIKNYNKRDLYFFDNRIRFDISSLNIKKNSIICKLDSLKAIIFEDECYVLYNYADISNIVSNFFLQPEKKETILDIFCKAQKCYYGFTKLVIEEQLLWYRKLKSLNVGCLRYFNAAGYDKNKRITILVHDHDYLGPRLTCPKIALIWGQDHDPPQRRQDVA